MALGEAGVEAEIFRHLDHATSFSLLRSTAENERLYPFTKRQEPTPVKLATLDQVFDGSPESFIPDVLIKLDVQGYEDRVIRGGIKTFSKAGACLFEASIDSLNEGQARFEEMTCQLRDCGYRYVGNFDQIYADDGHVIFLDAMFVRA